MELMHVFEETHNKDRQRHLEEWLGEVPNDIEDPNTGAFLACYCGGWVIPMKKSTRGDILIGAIWHRKSVRSFDD